MSGGNFSAKDDKKSNPKQKAFFWYTLIQAVIVILLVFCYTIFILLQNPILLTSLQVEIKGGGGKKPSLFRLA